MVCDRINRWRKARKPLIHLADAGKATPGALARALRPVPADDGNVILAVDAMAAHQAARRRLLDHAAHRVAIEGARTQRLDARIVGEVGWDLAVAGHEAGSNRRTGSGVTSKPAFSNFRFYERRPWRSGRWQTGIFPTMHALLLPKCGLALPGEAAGLAWSDVRLIQRSCHPRDCPRRRG
jgi:hypothetical protein